MFCCKEVDTNGEANEAFKENRINIQLTLHSEIRLQFFSLENTQALKANQETASHLELRNHCVTSFA